MLHEKGKKAKSYTNLQLNLLKKLEELATPESKQPEIDELELDKSQQSVKIQTEKNQIKLVQAKKSIMNNKKNTFLTGVNIYQPETVEPEQQQQQIECQPADTNLLHEVSAIKTDDLEQLRRMIKDTDDRLNDYGRDVRQSIIKLGKTKNQVMDAASRFGKISNRSNQKFKSERYSELLPKIEERLTTTKHRFSSYKGKLVKLN